MTDNRTNEQIVADELDEVWNFSKFPDALEAAEVAVSSLEAANRLVNPTETKASPNFVLDDATVERAAAAYWLAAEREIHDDVPWEWSKEDRKRFMWAARQVLEGAGAVPVTEDAVERAMIACIESAHIPTGMRAHLVTNGVPTIREQVDLEFVVETILKAAAIAPQAEWVKPCAHAVCLCTPVQPSSTVDEGKIADVLTDHVLMEPNGGTSSWSWCECSCGFEVKREGATRDYVEKLARKHQARAVVEAIGGESR